MAAELDTGVVDGVVAVVGDVDDDDAADEFPEDEAVVATEFEVVEAAVEATCWPITPTRPASPVVARRVVPSVALEIRRCPRRRISAGLWILRGARCAMRGS